MEVDRGAGPTSSTQQQVGPGLSTGSGLRGSQLELSPEPRVEQGHAQEVEPAHEITKTSVLNMLSLIHI